jgi:hypothetical protein
MVAVDQNDIYRLVQCLVARELEGVEDQGQSRSKSGISQSRNKEIQNTTSLMQAKLRSNWAIQKISSKS